MVGILFFLMVGLDYAYDWLTTKMSNAVGKTRQVDPEDPAALVGSFKRYK